MTSFRVEPATFRLAVLDEGVRIVCFLSEILCEDISDGAVSLQVLLNDRSGAAARRK
jgi:hypothetical protein